MAQLFDAYLAESGWDEMFEAPDRPRRLAGSLYDALRALAPGELEERCAESDRSFRDQGITFALSGEERPFPLDPIPRLISAREWRTIADGVVQRVRALECFLADVYGPGEVFADGIAPRRLVATSRQFRRRAWGVTPANGVRIQVAGIDLVRGADGRFLVLEDNVRIPSGVSYVIENRRAMARVFPELLLSQRVQTVSEYPAQLLAALVAARPRRARAAGAIVVLTPGVGNSAYFEHSFLARQMGVELVEGRDLVCRDQRVYMRTTAGDRPVDVVYRRVDDEYLDPVHFRSDSLLGCAGILNAARAGNVTIANAVGNGVADDKLAYTYVPDLITYYLGERPILDNVVTYRLEDADARAEALGRLDELVIKPVDGSGGYGIVIGPQAKDEVLAAVGKAIAEHPRDFIAQEVVALSTVPSKIGGHLEARHVDLRPFAVNDGEAVRVLPGGLTRVALGHGNLVVNSSQGGGSKDTWVLAADDGDGDGDGDEADLAGGDPAGGPVPLTKLPGDWAGQELGPRFVDTLHAQVQQQQQQQQQQGRRPGTLPGTSR